MKNFRFIYGFLILAILASGLYVTNIVILVNSLNPSSNAINGLPSPRGKYSLGEIIEAYDLDKDDFYEALHLSIDYPESKKVMSIVRHGDISYSDIKNYMDPIIKEFENK